MDERLADMIALTELYDSGSQQNHIELMRGKPKRLFLGGKARGLGSGLLGGFGGLLRGGDVACGGLKLNI